MSQILWNIPKWPKLISLMLADHNEKTFNRWFYDWRPKWNLHKITISSPNSIPIPVYCQEFYKVLYLTIWGTKEDKINQKMSHFLFKLKSVSRPLETIWGHLRPLEVIWDYVRLFEAMWGHWGYLRPCEVISGHVRSLQAFEVIWVPNGTKLTQKCLIS